MPASKKEREANRQAFNKMNTREKIDYIFAYYKLPIFTACIVLVVAVTSIVRAVTKKDVVFYLSYINTVFGDTLNTELTDGYLTAAGIDTKKNEVLVYSGLYIDEDANAENHDFAYASKLKILGAISAKQMDAAIMNDNAVGQMSASGLLLNLENVKEAFPMQYEKLHPYMMANTVILDDNSIEYDLNEADTYEAVTEEVLNSIDVSSFPIFQNAGIDGRISVGVIANTTHLENVLNYFVYLLGEN
ncbi:MAG TPA: hypothetical protein DHW39_08350 [Erysipelotrichaceae bacterium]|nr:hypothetical protein [Erysipelotrichaceae bacterium]